MKQTKGTGVRPGCVVGEGSSVTSRASRLSGSSLRRQAVVTCAAYLHPCGLGLVLMLGHALAATEGITCKCALRCPCEVIALVFVSLIKENKLIYVLWFNAHLVSTHARTHAHIHARARTHAHTHTHTHTRTHFCRIVYLNTLQRLNRTKTNKHTKTQI